MREVLEGELITQRHADGRVEIVQAPDRTTISLEFLATMDQHLVRATGSLLNFAGQVEYRVVGWDSIQHVLIAERSSR